VIRANGELAIREGIAEAREAVEDAFALCSTELLPWLTPWDREVLLKPVMTLTERECIQGSWASENVAVLLWALSREELLPYDRKFDSEICLDLVYADTKVAEFAQESTLRDPSELELQALTTETVFWRLRVGSDTENIDYAKKLMRRATILGHLPALIEDDLPIRGKPCSRANPADFQEVVSIASERLRALNWLMGQEKNWDDVTADTVVQWLWDDFWQGDSFDERAYQEYIENLE
jgi:hypothetical protein